MPSASLTERLTEEFRQIQAEYDPSAPLEIVQGRATRLASRTLTQLRGYVSELDADASQREDWPLANALSELFETIGR